MKKTFDCVKMKRSGAEKIYKQTAGMSKEQEIIFWREKSQALRNRQNLLIEEYRKVSAG